MSRQEVYIVKGKLSNKNNSPISGLLVQAFDVDPNSSADFLGTSISDEKGKYQIRYARAQFERPTETRGPDLIIKVFSPQGELLQQTPRKDNASVKENISIQNIDYPPEHIISTDKFYTIQGKVLGEEGEAIAGVIVEALEQGLPGSTKPTQAVGAPVVSQADGSYEIKVPYTELYKHGQATPDLTLQVSDREGQSIQRYTKYNAGKREELHLRVPKFAYKKAAEFDLLDKAIRKFLPQGIAIKDIKESKEEQGIRYLAKKTRWDARLVAMQILAYKYSGEARAKLPENFFYALLRAEGASDRESIYRIHVDQAMAQYQKAITENIITADAGSFNRLKKAFKQESVRYILKSKQWNSCSTVQDMLSLSLNNAADKRKFVELYYQGEQEPEKKWEAITAAFGETRTAALQLDGRLGFLTFNNAPLIARLKREEAVSRDPVELIHNGYYQSQKWEALISEDEVPPFFTGEDRSAKRTQYIHWISRQLQRSYPTQVIAERIKSAEFDLATNHEVRDEVYQALYHNRNGFQLGKYPINTHLEDLETAGVVLQDNAKAALKKLHRAYQLSPSDEAMAVLLQRDLASAFKIIRYSKKQFVHQFKEDFGGNESTVASIYDKATMDASTIANVTLSYLVQANNPLPATISQPLSNSPTISVKKYPKIEELFGSLDYCSCGHCESVLSPAAYLVDLLQFINLEGLTIKGVNPIARLREKRPDIEYIELSCENTNTVLPYIDLVNEVLEYFIIHPDVTNPAVQLEHSLNGFEGHNIRGGISSEELLANPQYVNREAYQKLKTEIYPFNLPFNRDLELSRAYLNHLGKPLYQSMEVLRANDQMSASAPAYGWQEIFSEQLGISPQLYQSFTNPASHSLQARYGLAETATPNDHLANAKSFSQITNITHKELIELLRSEFINPNSFLLPRLEHLQGVLHKSKEDDPILKTNYGAKSLFEIIRDLNNGDAQTIADFDLLFPASSYQVEFFGGDLRNWLQETQHRINQIIFLKPITDEPDCDFDHFSIQYTNPDNGDLHDIEYWKLWHFIRLWKKLGWSIEKLDRAIRSLTDLGQKIAEENDVQLQLDILHDGYRDLINKLALLKRVEQKLRLRADRNFEGLLTLWGEINTQGRNPLYHRLFLRTPVTDAQTAFLQNSDGSYLTDQTRMLLDHKISLQSAFKIREPDWNLLIDTLDFDQTTILSLANSTKMFRYAFLAQTLRIGIAELLALKALSGVDPFVPFTYSDGDVYQTPALLRFLEIVEQLKQSEFKIQELRFLLEHNDPMGTATPQLDDSLSFGKQIYIGLKGIDETYPVGSMITEESALALLTTLYGNEAAGTIQAILSESRSFSTAYSHSSHSLDPSIIEIDSRLFYDNFGKQLSFKGLLSEPVRDALKAVPGTSPDFKTAIDMLYDRGQKEYQNFFRTYPEFADVHAAADRIEDIVQAYIAPLVEKFKRMFVRQSLSAALDGVDTTFLQTILEEQLTDEVNYIFHANEQVLQPAMADFLTLAKNGITTEYFNGDDLNGMPIGTANVLTNINFAPTANNQIALPQNTADASQNISGRWTFYLEATSNDHYNFYFDTDADAEVKLFIDETAVSLLQLGNSWHNQDAISLEAGRWYQVELQALHIKEMAVLKWQQKGGLKEMIPSQLLYPFSSVSNFLSTYIRLLKIIRFIDQFKLSAAEVKYFSNEGDFKFGAIGFLNQIPIRRDIPEAEVHELFTRTLMLQEYASLREKLKFKDDRLIDFWLEPNAVNEEGAPLLYQITNWGEKSVQAILQQFAGNDSLQELKNRKLFSRLNQALDWIQQSGFAATNLLAWSSPYSDGDIVSDIQNSLRTKYDEAVWLNVLQPIKDKLRVQQRDALVDYILKVLAKDSATAHIDTANKLFEYFLIDVAMDACMKTSRIKQAISSVQLFIYRCLMNLEPGVDSTSINADYWEWMKRYRVWEANRKVFLYPENWLEPALRSTKSPIYKEFEGELLQSDIDEERAEVALLNYLEKLDRIAQLEICGMCREDKERLHVVGKTSGTIREYYHRRYDGTWSAWEKINLDIGSDPVIPVFWRDRLFLFWTTVLQKGKEGNQIPASANSNDLSSFNGKSARIIEFTLCWSEFYNDKWQTKRTSDMNIPIFLESKNDFTSNNLALNSFPEEEQLRITFSYSDQSGPKKLSGSFIFYNKNSLPFLDMNNGYSIVNESIWENFAKGNSRSIYNKKIGSNSKTLQADFHPASGNDESHFLILHSHFHNITEPAHPIPEIFREPFFCSDHRHTFFVEMYRKYDLQVWEWPSYGFEGNQILELDADTTKPWIIPELPQDKLEHVVQDWEDIFRRSRLIDPTDHEVELPNVILTKANRFLFEDVEIGLHGSLIQNPSNK